MLQRVINKHAQVASLGVVASSLQRADLIGADRIRVRCLAHAIIVPAFHYAVKRQFMSLATDNSLTIIGLHTCSPQEIHSYVTCFVFGFIPSSLGMLREHV